MENKESRAERVIAFSFVGIIAYIAIDALVKTSINVHHQEIYGVAKEPVEIPWKMLLVITLLLIVMIIFIKIFDKKIIATGKEINLPNFRKLLEKARNPGIHRRISPERNFARYIKNFLIENKISKEKPDKEIFNFLKENSIYKKYQMDGRVVLPLAEAEITDLVNKTIKEYKQ